MKTTNQSPTSAYIITLEPGDPHAMLNVPQTVYYKQTDALKRCKDECAVLHDTTHPNADLTPVELHFETEDGHPETEVIGFSLYEKTNPILTAIIHRIVLE